MENQASRGRAAGYRGKGRQQSQNRNQNRNLRQNSSQNQLHREADGPQSGAPREAAAHLQDSGRGRSFTEPATPHSATPRGNRGAGGRGRGGRGGARQPSSAASSTRGALEQASQPTPNSFSMSTATTTSVTQMAGAPNGYSWSHQGSALISWCVGSTVGRLNYIHPTFVRFIIFFLSEIIIFLFSRIIIFLFSRIV
ncbi:uncharacterized protein LOC131218740 [Magnolia sinica]|uniref:uncharacterized protein LOC131218740 n=1 Tax=Magnolia sinica TaxID=86752 RepID=UPI00265B6581|nr:uncharacterized protein LOC131218740 [Magnolia sinica]